MAFGPLAEELRRAGRHREAAIVCRTGLAAHPDYLSARVTLGQALFALEHLDDAQRELEHVLISAPENLVATRALAEIRARRAATPAQSAEPAVGSASAVTAPTLTTEITQTTEIAETTEITEATETPENDIFSVTSVVSVVDTAAPQNSAADSSESLRIAGTLAALESWLAAVYVTRAERRA